MKDVVETVAIHCGEQRSHRGVNKSTDVRQRSGEHHPARLKITSLRSTQKICLLVLGFHQCDFATRLQRPLVK